MSRHLVLSSLLFLVAGCAGVVWARHCPGCIDRARVNTQCEWSGGGSLVADAQLAEELSIRYADAAFNRQYGYDGHGGLEGSARKTCMAWLVAAIEREHGVTEADVAVARGQRNRIFDAAAALSFAPLFVLGATIAGGRLRRRFANDRGAVQSIAAALTAVAVSFLGLQVGQLWLSVWETLRVRNGHISVFRFASRTIWTHEYAWLLFGCGIAVCWLVARSPHVASVRRASRGASMAAGTLLAAAFADVFVEHLLGYVLLASALVVFLGAVSRLEPALDAAPQGMLLR